MKKWFKKHFGMAWETRPWWFNLFIAWPLAILTILFLPVGYIFIQRFRNMVNGVCGALEHDVTSER